MDNAKVVEMKRAEQSWEHRCVCGKLMAKITPEGVELKCRKCKRIQLIPNSRIVYSGRTAGVGR